MNSRTKTVLFAAIALATIAGGASAAYAIYQADTSAVLRSSGEAGEQSNGYLGIVGSPSPGMRARVDAVNIKRRAYYTDIAARRGAKIEEVAATMACDLFANAVQPGQYYRLPDGIWRRRDGNTPIPRPSYCG